MPPIEPIICRKQGGVGMENAAAILCSMDFFSLFSLPRHLRIDTAALEKAFYAQSRKLHPDRFASRPLAEQESALAASSQLNDAYRTLRDPISRTEYLLALEGIQLEE